MTFINSLKLEIIVSKNKTKLIKRPICKNILNTVNNQNKSAGFFVHS